MSTVNTSDNIFVGVVPGVVSVWIKGEIDLANIDWLDRWLSPIRGADADVHFHLRGLQFIGVMGTSLLVDVADSLAPGRIALAHQPTSGMRMMLNRLWPSSRVLVADQEVRDDGPPGPWPFARQRNPV